MPKADAKPNTKNRIYKAIETWFAKIYLNKIIHNANNTSLFINKSSCLAFILSIYGKTEENKSKRHLLLLLILTPLKTLSPPS
ncbi:hypothetical protein YO45_08655 [Campylobacter jejuni]|nr:hypothetical protein [Campylobacter jejuni]